MFGKMTHPLLRLLSCTHFGPQTLHMSIFQRKYAVVMLIEATVCHVCAMPIAQKIARFRPKFTVFTEHSS